MNWITRLIKIGDKIKTNIKKKMATKAEQLNSPYMSCHGQPILKKIIIENNFVCPECNEHHKLEPHQYYDDIFFGKGNYEEIKSAIPFEDVLNWQDTKKYTDRLATAKKLSGLECGILSVKGKLKDIDVVMSCQSWAFIAGSVSMPEGENVLTAVERCLTEKLPYIFVAKSSGMRMMTNNLSLAQMPRMALAINELKKAKLPFICIVTSPTTGGTSASIVPLADIIIAESKKAIYGFAGKRIVANTENKPLNEDFQTAQWAQQNGQIDVIVDRKDLKDTLYNLLSILLKKKSEVNLDLPNETSETNIQTREAS